jgi:transposase InsO family protein
MELTLKERQKLTRLTAKKYQKAKKAEKTKILDTFTAQTGYDRKYAIHLLVNEGVSLFLGGKTRLTAAHRSGRKRVYQRVYDDAVRDALIPIWEAFNYQCGKLFAPFLHMNLDSICSRPAFALPAAVCEKLRVISASTIDRLLKKTKQARRIKGTSGTRPAPQHLKALIPVMSHFECKEQGAGLWQIDLVQHDGGNPSGEFCYTLTITEIQNCWTVHYVLKNKAFRWVFQALNDACSVLPLPVHIFHSDNGSEFINHALDHWCRQKGIALTRSRSDKKNDNCFVEQKNGSTVRKIVGYARFSGDKGIAALQAVYTPYDTLLNYFYPCQKLLSKQRSGSTVRKTYDAPQTPFARALAHTGTPSTTTSRLAAAKEAVDLMDEMERMNKALDLLPSLADPVPEFVSNRVLKPLRIKQPFYGSHG